MQRGLSERRITADQNKHSTQATKTYTNGVHQNQIVRKLLMFGMFKRDPKKKLQQNYERKLQAAMEASRNGDMRANATLTEEAEAILAEIKRLEQ
jgi:hypothetical protein